MTKDEALRLALEALKTIDEAMPFPVAKLVQSAIKEALAQPAPVQEPIGYLFQHEETGLTTVVDVQQVEWGFEKNNPRHQKIGPVYTTPPQRTWVGLTYEEESELIRLAHNHAGIRFYIQAAEAKLKEKNNG